MTRILLDTLHYYDGAAFTEEVSLGYWDGEEMTMLAPPLLVIPEGYDSVDDMLSRECAYFAHRGGSADYPEMSMRGYTQSVVEGFGCLEFSAQRTSDGVFIGCHDPSINRVVGLPGSDLVVANMTWEQIQEYRIEPPEDHPERESQPFIRIEDLVEAYGSTHIIMIDPKNIGSTHYAALLNGMDASGGPERWIGKWVGSNPTWSAALHERGYKGWGAYYNTDDQEMVAATQGQWDILGFNYGAPQDAWDFITSFGKKVYAHVCPTQASVDTGIAKGAVGAQVSGIEAVDVYKEF